MMMQPPIVLQDDATIPQMLFGRCLGSFFASIVKTFSIHRWNIVPPSPMTLNIPKNPIFPPRKNPALKSTLGQNFVPLPEIFP
jgi:hypothetical protein